VIREEMAMKTRSIIMHTLAAVCAAALSLAAGGAFAGERVLLAPDTPKSKIVSMNPSEVDPSLLPLDFIEDLNTTGVPRDVDIEVWRLIVSGKKVRNALSLTYDELGRMKQIKKRVILICPGVFVDYAEWEGVPLEEILEAAKVRHGFQRVSFRSEDGFSSSFTKEQVKNNLLFLAMKVNGEVLPKEHGFPVRLVAEDILGGSWVKWVKSIEVE
jgi:DMSO/TMAO reductase YedYZ molybdopterin-dependent catalytic subunit